MAPQTLAILPRIFPPERRGTAFGIWSSVAGLAIVVGPTLGGWLVTDYSWQAIFFVNVPVGVVAVLAAFLLLPEVRASQSHTLDLVGVALASGGLLSLIYALVESQRYAWGPISSFGSVSLGSTRWSVISVYSLLVYAGVLLVAFVWWETRARQPLLPLSLFGNWNFSLANLVMITISFALASFMVLSLFLQSALGMSAIHAGLTLIPASLGIMADGPIAGRLADRINGKYIVLAGLMGGALGIGLTAHALELSNTSWDLAMPLALSGVGMAFVLAPIITLTMRDVQPALTGAASGFLNTNRQAGQAVGSAVIGSVLANRVASELPAQAAHVAARMPLAFRRHFVAAFQQASHGSESFGVGQSHSRLAADPPHAAAQHLAALSHEVYGQAFLNAARPALVICAGVLLLGALFASRLRGGRSAEDARRVDAPELEDAA